jgi:hypothetical protein
MSLVFLPCPWFPLCYIFELSFLRLLEGYACVTHLHMTSQISPTFHGLYYKRIYLHICYYFKKSVDIGNP